MAKSQSPALLELKIEPRSLKDEQALQAALHECTVADPSFSFLVDPESGEVIIGGQCELQLDLVIDRLLNTHGISVQVGSPQVAYRETIARPADVDYRYKRQAQGLREFARVHLFIAPVERGHGNAFHNTLSITSASQTYVEAIEKAVNSVWNAGLLIGSPMTGMTVTLQDAEFDDGTSSASAFQAATRAAMKEGCEKAGLLILEPVMDVEIECPLTAIGAVLGDINARRGQVRDQAMRGSATIFRAYIPLAQLFGYANTINKLTSGKGRHAWTFSHYSKVPQNIPGGPDDFPPAMGMRA